MSKRARSAVSGRFVTFWYALTHPRSTVLEDAEEPKKREPQANKMRKATGNK